MADNPYQPPESSSQEPSPKTTRATNGKQPFSLQAAKFSLIAPFILVAFNLCTLPNRDVEHSRREREERVQIRFVFGIMSSVIIVAGFALGAVGLAGGIARRAIGTMVMALLGILLNGFLIVTSVMLIIQFSGR